MQPDGHTNSTGGNAVNPRGITRSAQTTCGRLGKRIDGMGAKPLD